MLCFPNWCLLWFLWHSNPLLNEVSEVPDMFAHCITVTSRSESPPQRNKPASVVPFCWQPTLIHQITGLSVCLPASHLCFRVILTCSRSLIHMLAHCHALSYVAPTRSVHPIIFPISDWSLALCAAAQSRAEVLDTTAIWDKRCSPMNQRQMTKLYANLH